MSGEVQIKTYRKGSSVVVQNAPNPGIFYIVRKGTLAIDTEHRLSDKVLSRFEPGDSFGLVSALTGHHFLVTIYAETDAEVAEIPVSKIGEYIRPEPTLAVKVLRLYSRELRTLQQHLAKLDFKGDRDATPERLYSVADRYRDAGKLHHTAYALKMYIEWAATHNGQKLAEARREFEEVKASLRNVQFSGKATHVPADTMIFAEGEIGQDIYVILEGTVNLVRFARGREFVIDILGAGELFGEMAFIEKAPRMGSAITLTDAKIIRIQPEQLVSAVAVGVLQKVFENMARRIWFAHQRLTIFRIDDPQMRMYAYLYNLMRNQNLRTKDKDAGDRSYRFEINYSQLKSLCGVLQLKGSSESEFLSNDNLLFEYNAITVRSRKKLADQISFYRAKTGQIIAETK